MAAPIVLPINQFFDANGDPLAGGTIETYVVATSTPKATYTDKALTALNENPVRLDAAGRCVMWGDGDFRLVLRDSVGNEIWDQTATSIVSAAMAPVVAAPTIADALNQLGVTDLIATEASDRAAADSAEQAARVAADNTLQSNIDAETARAEAAEANLQSEIDIINGATGPEGVLPAGYTIRFGAVVSDSGGNYSATFSPPFPSGCDAVTTACQSNSWWASVTSRSAGGFSGITSSPLHGGGWNGGPLGVFWIAIGH
jgi:hypothetical protein